MIQHCPVLIVLLPLTAALLCLLFSKFNKNLGSWLVIGSIAGSLACSLQVLHQTLTSGEAIHYWMGNWEPPLGIEFVIDPLSAVMAVLITFISLMVAVYSKPFMRKEDWLHIGGYYTLYGLLTVGLCGMVITGDMFNLYVYLEVKLIPNDIPFGIIPVSVHILLQETIVPVYCPLPILSRE